MKRYFGTALAIASLALSAQGASAQATGFFSAGATFPSGDYADFAKTGWLAQGGVGFPVGTAGLMVGLSGFYGMNSHESPPDGDKTALYGGGGYVLYNIGEAGSAQPYVFAGPVYMVHSYKSDTFPEDSNSGLAVQGGAGVNIPVGSLTGYLEGMYSTALSDDIDGTDFFAVSAGINIPLG
jgi:hypothetical protein